MTSLPLRERVLVTGSTGYIGGRLVPRPVSAGINVRCVTRSVQKARARPWSTDPAVEVQHCELDD